MKLVKMREISIDYIASCKFSIFKLQLSWQDIDSSVMKDDRNINDSNNND